MTYLSFSDLSIDLLPPCETHIRPLSHVIDKAKLINMMKSNTPVGKLSILTQLFSKEKPVYTVHTIIDENYSTYFTSTVEFANQKFESFPLRTWKRDAMEDAAGLAFDHFLKKSSIIPYLDIPKEISTISPLSALKTLCWEKDWKAKFVYTGSKEDGWRCSISVDMVNETAYLGEGEIFHTKRDAKIDAAAAMYDRLFE